MIKGIDVSSWQGDIDFEKVKQCGIDFVILRAGYGRGSARCGGSPGYPPGTPGSLRRSGRQYDRGAKADHCGLQRAASRGHAESRHPPEVRGIRNGGKLPEPGRLPENPPLPHHHGQLAGYRHEIPHRYPERLHGPDRPA